MPDAPTATNATTVSGSPAVELASGRVVSVGSLAAVNGAVAAANTLPALIANAKVAAPALAAKLNAADPKPLIQSKSPWVAMAGTLAGMVAAYLANNALPVGLPTWAYVVLPAVGTLLGAYAIRSVTSAPISGILSSP